MSPLPPQISLGFFIALLGEKLERLQIEEKRCNFHKEKLHHEISERSTPYILRHHREGVGGLGNDDK